MAEAENKAAEPCGGCGETNPHRRCIGCLHEFLPKPPHQEEGAAGLAERLSDWRARGVSGEDADAAASALLSQASQIEALRKERDEANAEIERMMPKFVAYDYLESPAGREIAETKLAEAVEQAFRDGLAYGTNVRNADPDLAWGHSRAKAFLDANGGGQ